MTMAVDRRYRARLVPGSRRRSHRLWRRVAPAAVVALVVMPVSLALGAPRVAAAAPAAATRGAPSARLTGITTRATTAAGATRRHSRCDRRRDPGTSLAR